MMMKKTRNSLMDDSIEHREWKCRYTLTASRDPFQ